MRILHLAHRLPYPPNKGDKIRTFHVLSHLSGNHEVCLATLVDDSADLEWLPELRSRVGRLLYARIDGIPRRLLSLRQWPLGGSITVSHFHRRSLQHAVDRLIDERVPDLVLCSSSPMAEYLFQSRHWHGRLGGIPKIMDLIDVDSLKWRQYAERVAAPRKWVFDHEARHLAGYEKRIYREFDRMLLVSAREVSHFPGGDPAGKLVAIPNGVDLDFFRAGAGTVPRGDESTLVFVGMMDYWPNIEGVKWFIEEVLPLIRASVPRARLVVVGGRPTAEVSGWGDREGIEVTGYVEDVRTYMAAADVCVVPLRIARGIQNKVLEAMAMGLPIVTTPDAFEGIEAEPDRHALVAADAKPFADAVTRLLQQPQEAAALGTAARQQVETRYDWRQSLATLDGLINGLVGRSRSSIATG